jgi:hypothetical protein
LQYTCSQEGRVVAESKNCPAKVVTMKYKRIRGNLDEDKVRVTMIYHMKKTYAFLRGPIQSAEPLHFCKEPALFLSLLIMVVS